MSARLRLVFVAEAPFERGCPGERDGAVRVGRAIRVVLPSARCIFTILVFFTALAIFFSVRPGPRDVSLDPAFRVATSASVMRSDFIATPLLSSSVPSGGAGVVVVGMVGAAVVGARVVVGAGVVAAAATGVVAAAAAASA